MAKTCKVCKKTYPDEMADCPHCAAESIDFLAEAGGRDEHSPVVRLPEPTGSDEGPMKSSDSDIDLNEALSVLGDESAQGPPSKPKFDSPSDRDLLEKMKADKVT